MNLGSVPLEDVFYQDNAPGLPKIVNDRLSVISIRQKSCAKEIVARVRLCFAGDAIGLRPAGQ